MAGRNSSADERWEKGKLFDTNWGNLGPSIGLAWDPSGGGRTSLRTNYRIAFDRIPTFLLSSAVFRNLPGLTVSVLNTDYGQGGGRLAGMPRLGPPSTKPGDLTHPIPFSSSVMTVVESGVKTPTTLQWASAYSARSCGARCSASATLAVAATTSPARTTPTRRTSYATGFLSSFNTVKAGGESELINRAGRFAPRRQRDRLPDACGGCSKPDGGVFDDTD